MWGDTQNHLPDVTSPCEKHSEAPQNSYPILKKNVLDKDLPTIPAIEVGQHTGIVVDEIVYDCTDFVGKHPGGSHIIREFGGHDCSWQWWTFHGKPIHDQYMPAMRVGRASNVTNKHEKPQRKAFQLRMIGEQW